MGGQRPWVGWKRMTGIGLQGIIRATICICRRLDHNTVEEV